MKTIISLTVFLVVFSSVAFAIAPGSPGIPNQFWGAVTINGLSAPDGTSITSKVNGVFAESTTTSSGSYSLIIKDPNNANPGKTVLLYVNGVQAGTDFFVEGGSTQVNLAITVSTTQSNPSGGSGSGGGGGGSASAAQTSTVKTTTANNGGNSSSTTPSGPCRERWTCDAWSECNKDGIQKRTCNDSNKCGTIDDLPMTTQPCATDTTNQASNTQSSGLSGITGRMVSFASGSAAYAIGLIVLVGLGAYFFKGKHTSKK